MKGSNRLRETRDEAEKKRVDGALDKLKLQRLESRHEAQSPSKKPSQGRESLAERSAAMRLGSSKPLTWCISKLLRPSCFASMQQQQQQCLKQHIIPKETVEQLEDKPSDVQ